jgi:hypothetical protein
LQISNPVWVVLVGQAQASIGLKTRNMDQLEVTAASKSTLPTIVTR